MKSNQERSNECLPPKKRDFPASNLPSDEKPLVAPASESQRGENLAWLANVASRQNNMGSGRHSNTGIPAEAPDVALYKPLPNTVDYSSSARVPRTETTMATLPAVYSSTISQPGMPVSSLQNSQLPHAFQFISSPYPGPYTSYIPSQLISPTATSAAAPCSQRSQLEAYTTAVMSQAQASKAEHHQHQQHHMVRTPGLIAPETPPPFAQPPNQYVQIAGSPSGIGRAVSSPPSHIPLHLHSHPAVIPHALALSGNSQLVVHYTDGNLSACPPAKKLQEDGRTREVLNGELDKGRRYSLSHEASLGKPNSGGKGSPHHHHHHQHQQHQQQQQHHHYETRHVVLPGEYNTQETSGIRTSLMLVPNSHASSSTDLEAIREQSPSSIAHIEKTGLCLGKPNSRSSSYTLSSPQLGTDGVKATAATLSPHTVIQTTHNATEQISMGLSAASYYPNAAQQPIIGYIAGSSQQQHQQAISYHTNLPQHLVIPGSQSLLIPVGGGSGDVEAGPTIVTSSLQFAAVPHTFVTTTVPFGAAETLVSQPSTTYHAAMVQAQIHLPMVQPMATATPPSVLTPPATSSSLPPYFMKGSIIQLANGELKKVEDLKTEDFIQSAEVSSDLKIDSSTVERIEGSQNPSFAIIQFAVGEHRAQVSVEVLVEYPFFVFGQGWSSCCPEQTTQLFNLPCIKLSVGDVCISLTLKNLKNGSLKKGQLVDPTGSLFLKPPKNDSLHGSRVRYVEHENGVGQRGGGGTAGTIGTQTTSENGELKFLEKTGQMAGCRPLVIKTEAGNKPTTRKRRWSAPESRKVEKWEEEPPLTLPRPSFIPQEVKISIEGLSNLGK
ncbi:ataxin-1-like [Polyodon spathula]|uniref:ataxin-1-like n=1 Tax=Polyodon spathula TaxID=7913 RepID=UPI001B7E3F38|nr:ataxin-1-like [Polyodon spathula]XP_041104462.1 ataxin-1-like [Polyodon spathula]XP_041104463.1 ataxin-1-like [Polyodon spathula]XP_041104464.1 ataxin-1-like [Polyodon spathula]